MKTGYPDINISRNFKTNLSHTAVVEKVFLAIKGTDSVDSKLVDASTIYFENDMGTMVNRWDLFYGAWFGKIIISPHEDGIQFKYQISILPYRVLALAFLLFGFAAPIYILGSKLEWHLFVCMQIPFLGTALAVFLYLFGIAVIVARLDKLIQKAIKD
jgi:hypothetical protein